ncbi:phospholipase [Pueribacillus sp. YX66]|uniref:phospholipase n=1 Tax=Pueribacillus sp. YX66 TaxID=3229242 RepID=UPI00358D0E15
MILPRRSRGFRICIFPGYNWCGPGCSGPGAPINDVDAACKAHDECYRNYGNIHACDQVFLERLQPLINPYTLQGRQARTLYHFMKVKMLFN